MGREKSVPHMSKAEKQKEGRERGQESSHVSEKMRVTVSGYGGAWAEMYQEGRAGEEKQESCHK